MLNRKNLVLVCLLAGLAASCSKLEAQANQAAPATRAQVGRPAPDFTLRDQDGRQVSLRSYRGRVTVLEWINPQCPFVQRHYEANTMKRTSEQLAPQRVAWLAIDSSHYVTPAASREWKQEHGLSYPILQDPSGRVGRLYGAKTTPHMFVIDAQGVLRYAGAIDDDPRGRSERPTNHVARAARALLSGGQPPVATTEPYGCSVKYED